MSEENSNSDVPLQTNELDALLDVAGNLRLLYLTSAYTGLRLGELQSLC